MGFADARIEEKDSDRIYRFAEITYVTKKIVYSTDPFSNNKRARLKHDPEKLGKTYVLSKNVRICTSIPR